MTAELPASHRPIGRSRPGYRPAEAWQHPSRLPIQPNCEIDVENSQHDGSKPGDGWGLFSGTSAAAPQLAGVCALLLEKSPSLSPSEIKQIIRRTSRDVINGSANKASSEGVVVKATSGGDGATGTGLVDAFAAFKQL